MAGETQAKTHLHDTQDTDGSAKPKTAHNDQASPSKYGSRTEEVLNCH